MAVNGERMTEDRGQKELQAFSCYPLPATHY